MLPEGNDVRIIMHNAAFDIARLRDNFGISVWNYSDLVDTILMHHLLYPELPHRLEFIASTMSMHSKAKHLGVGNYNYLIGDLVCTAEAYEAMLEEFKRDPQSAVLYYNEYKPLLPVIIEFMGVGIPVNSDFVAECLDWMPGELSAAKTIAEAYCGYPISLESGPQLRVMLDEIEDVFNVAKKLTGISVPKMLTERGEISLDKETIAALRGSFLPVDYNEELTSEVVLARITNGAHPLLEAKALWGRVRVLMSNYIKPLLISLEGSEDNYTYQGQLHTGEGAPSIDFKEMEGY